MGLARDTVTASCGQRELPKTLEAQRRATPAHVVAPPDPMGLQNKAVDARETRHQAHPRPIEVMEGADVVAVRSPTRHQGLVAVRAAIAGS